MKRECGVSNVECRVTGRAPLQHSTLDIRRLTLAFLGIVMLVGCETSSSSTSSSSGSDFSTRQDAAMKDPFSYGPAEHSGKNVQQEPKKRDETLKGEWDRFWNP